MWVSFSFIEQTFMMRPSYAKPWRETDSYLTCGHHPPSLGVFIICVEPNQVVTLVVINDYITSLTKRVHIERGRQIHMSLWTPWMMWLHTCNVK